MWRHGTTMGWWGGVGVYTTHEEKGAFPFQGSLWAGWQCS